MTGREVREIRLRLGFTQRTFAEKLGVRENSVARWERGEMGIRSSRLRVIRLLLREHSAQVRTALRPHRAEALNKRAAPLEAGSPRIVAAAPQVRRIR
jgi:transcriptional regulator with XRE-family HTH domain